MVADRGDNLRRFIRRKAKAGKNLEGEACAVLRMVMAVDEISNIVHIACNLCELAGARIVTQLPQDA